MAANNSSKTAHVMNLLSKNRPAEPAAPKAEPQAAAPQAEAAPQPEPAHAAPVAPIISSINADAAVSSQIKDALEAELQDIPAPQAAPAPQPPQQTAPVQQTASVQQAVSVQQAAPVQQAVSVQQAAPVQQAEPARREVPPVPEEPAQEEAPEEETPPSYVNVMQLLVEEKADEYMKMFGICCCDKCRVDVRAYALNHLPPKYVVLGQNERVPRLTVYENRFSSDITAQLIQACKQVMLTPHHTRLDG